MRQLSKQTLSVGVVGLGHWGPNVVRNLARHPRVRLRCVCDTNPDAFERVQLLVEPECRRVLDADEVYGDPEVDAVVIVTPAASHYPLAKRALESGKHVFCEKPLALAVEEGEELCALADRAGLKLMVGHTFLFNNAVLKLKELIDGGHLGEKIYYLTATRTHLGLVRKDASVLWDLAPHDVAIMNFLLGAVPERVSAVGARPLLLAWEDVAFLHLTYPNGVIGSIHVSWVDSHKERMLAVIGDKGRVVFNDLDNLEPVRLFQKGIGVCNRITPGFGEYQFLLRDGDIISPKVEIREPLNRMLDAFVQVVLDNVPDISSGRTGLDVTRVLAAAETSMREGGAPQNIA